MSKGIRLVKVGPSNSPKTETNLFHINQWCPLSGADDLIINKRVHRILQGTLPDFKLVMKSYVHLCIYVYFDSPHPFNFI